MKPQPTMQINPEQTVIQVFYQARVVIKDAKTDEILETRAHKDVSKDSTEWVRANRLFVLGTSISSPVYRNLVSVAGVDMSGKTAFISETFLAVTAAPLLTSEENDERPGAATPADIHPERPADKPAAGANTIGATFPDVV